MMTAMRASQDGVSSARELGEFAFVTQKKEFLEDLDRVREEVTAPAQLEAVVVGSTIAATSGLSIGYVLWLLRSGLLMASVLSSMPAWRTVDPLPVLAHFRKRSEKEGEDTDSLDTLIRRHAELPSPTSRPESEFRPGTDVGPSATPARPPIRGRSIRAEGPT